MRWMIVIECINMNTKMSLLSSHSAMPRQRHLEGSQHIMAYLKPIHNSRVVFDSFYPNIDHNHFWEYFYEGAVDSIPSDPPPKRGKEVDLDMFIDSNHACNKQITRSNTRVMIYMNMSLINWYSS